MARNYKAEEKYKKQVFKKIPKLPADIDDWVRNNPLGESKYLFCSRIDGTRFGYCTHCGKTSQLDGLKRTTTYEEIQNGCHKHNEWGYCPACHSQVQFKDAGRGRGKMYDYSKFLIILRKDNGIFLRFFDVVRDYRDSYKDVETEFTEEYRAFFCDGKTTMWRRDYTNDYWVPRGEPSRVYSDDWITMSKVTDGYGFCMIYHSGQLQEEVFAGTPFQYCMFDSYARRSGDYFAPVRYLEKACKYSAIEQLSKIGLTRLVDDYINDRNYSPMVYWRGKIPQKVLGLTKSEIQELRKLNPSAEEFNVYKFFNHSVKGLTQDEKLKYIKKYSFYEIKDIPSKIPKEADPKHLLRYVEKQMQRKKNQYRSNILRDWFDYISNCKLLKYNLSDETILFPRDLKKAHDRAYQLVEVSKNKLQDESIRALFLKKMKRYAYREKGYFLTVASCAADLIREGQLMHHCVGTYIGRVAKDECTILFIRSTAAPDTPLATAEVRGNEPIQIRAHNDEVPEKPVMEFWERFKSEKLKKNKRQKVEERKAG